MSNLEWIAVDLVPRPVLHGAHDGQPERAVLYFGRPFTVPLDVESAAQSLRAFAEENNEAIEFRLLVVHLNLAPREGEPISYATVSAVIELPDDRAIFHEVSPLRLTRTVSRDSRATISASLGPVQPGMETGTQYETRVDFVQARGVGTRSVQWEFRKTSGRELAGVYELAAAVAVPRGMQGSVLLSAAAGIRRKRLGVISHRAELPTDVRVVPLP